MKVLLASALIYVLARHRFSTYFALATTPNTPAKDENPLSGAVRSINKNAPLDWLKGVTAGTGG